MKQVNYMQQPGPGPQGYATVPATSDAKEYLALILRHKFGILLTLLLGVAIATLYLISTTPVYQSEALIEVDDTNPLDDNTVVDWTRPTIKEEANILRSRRVLQPVVELYQLRNETHAKKFKVLGDVTQRIPALGNWLSKLDFAKSYAWHGEEAEITNLSVPRAWEDEPLTMTSLGDGNYSLAREGQMLVESARVGENLRLDVGDTAPLTLTVTSLDAPEGVEFSVIRRSLESTINGVRASLATETSDAQSRMITVKYLGTDPVDTTDVTNQIVQVYRDVKLSNDIGDTVKEREIFESNLPNVKTELEAAENALSTFRRRSGTIDSGVQSRNILGQIDVLQRELTQQEIERDKLRERYTRIHPSTKRLDEEIAIIQRQINQLNGRVRATPNNERELEQLQQEVDNKRTIYNEMSARLENIRIKESITSGSVKIWDTAIVPERPVSPNKLLALVGATLGTLFLYMLYLTLRSALSTLISDQESLERASGLPVYMSIPKSSAQKRLASAPVVDPRRLLPGAEGKSDTKALTNVLAVGKPDDYSVESMRGLRSMLEDVMDGAKNNILMITSPLPSMGKSFISLNLAVLLAQSGKRVLLIDADHQRGQLHKQFGLKMGPGLPEVVRGKSELKETVKATQVENLYLIPRGFMNDGSGREMPGDREFGRFMDVVAHRFDICIIDTPPVLSVSTAASLGKQAGSTLMVVKEGEIKEPQLAESLKRLSFSGIRVNGCILNGASAPTPRHYAYYREQLD